jgi:hypothetical protein
VEPQLSVVRVAVVRVAVVIAVIVGAVTRVQSIQVRKVVVGAAIVSVVVVSCQRGLQCSNGWSNSCWSRKQLPKQQTIVSRTAFTCWLDNCPSSSGAAVFGVTVISVAL